MLFRSTVATAQAALLRWRPPPGPVGSPGLAMTRIKVEPKDPPAQSRSPTPAEPPATSALRMQATALSARLKATRALLAIRTEAQLREALKLQEQALQAELHPCLGMLATAQAALLSRRPPPGAVASPCLDVTGVKVEEPQDPPSQSRSPAVSAAGCDRCPPGQVGLLATLLLCTPRATLSVVILARLDRCDREDWRTFSVAAT